MVNIQDLPLEAVLDDEGQKALSAQLPAIMQQVRVVAVVAPMAGGGRRKPADTCLFSSTPVVSRAWRTSPAACAGRAWGGRRRTSRQWRGRWWATTARRSAWRSCSSTGPSSDAPPLLTFTASCLARQRWIGCRLYPILSDYVLLVAFRCTCVLQLLETMPLLSVYGLSLLWWIGSWRTMPLLSVYV